MSASRRTPLLLAAAALVLAAGLLALLLSGGSPSLSEGHSSHLSEAIDKLARYLERTDLRGDDAWIATQGASKLGPTFRTWAETLSIEGAAEQDRLQNPLNNAYGMGVEGRLLSLRWLEEQPLPPLPAPEPRPDLVYPTAITEDDIRSLLRVMSYTSVCTRLDEAQRQDWLDLLAQETNGYLLTHQLLALILGYNQRCLDLDTIEPLRAKLATRLYYEQANDDRGIDDLSVERMAILCYAQVCDWLDPESIDLLIREQDPSGSWGERNPGVHERVVARESHTASLALYALASTWRTRFPDLAPPLPPDRR